MNIRENESLKSLHTMGCELASRYYAEVESKEDVLDLLADPKYRKLPKFWLGGGSNTLFIGDFPGLVIRLANKGIQTEADFKERTEIRVQAGENWSEFVRYTIDKAWWGVENLSGIPGSVGGAVVQNMGAYGQEIAEVIERVEVLDLNTMKFKEIPQEECGYAYRSSRFKGQGRWLVWSVVLSLGKRPAPCLEYKGLQEIVGKNPTQEEIAQAVLRLRQEKLPDPAELGSVGSFFTNPVVPEAEAVTERGPMIMTRASAKLNSLRVNFIRCPPSFLSGRRLGTAAAFSMDRPDYLPARARSSHTQPTSRAV